ncbi:MAG: hypothetical protein KAT05_09525 [Spirochaetes bacterium]|nr:hypothetical protein [Spirochaetota bacterium]
MSLEIEKKFLVGNFEEAYKNLTNDFGKHVYKLKPGFWWCNNYESSENMLNIQEPKLSKNEVSAIKDIGEFTLPIQNYQYIRLRVLNQKKYIVTFKIKSLVNNIEQNIEYEFEVEKDIFKRIALYLIETAFIFYYNIKETWEFNFDDIKIEISKFNDLKDSYIEIETLGDNEEELFSKLNKSLKKFFNYSIKEETKSYAKLSSIENMKTLKRLKLSQYSREGYRCLQKYLV